jgi:hypothetical protein
MLEKIPLLNSRSVLIKIIGILAYGTVGIFILAGLGSIVNPNGTNSAASSTVDLLDLDMGPYQVSFEKPRNYEPEIEPLEISDWHGYTSPSDPLDDLPAYRSYFRRISEDGKDFMDPERLILVYIRDFEEPQFNETLKEYILRDDLKLGNKYRLQSFSFFNTLNRKYIVVEDNEPWVQVGAGCWIDQDTMFTIEMSTFDRDELESALESLVITEKDYSG